MYKIENVRDTKNLITITTTCYMTNYEWWRSKDGSIFLPLIIRYMTSYDKNYEIFCVIIKLKKMLNFNVQKKRYDLFTFSLRNI